MTAPIAWGGTHVGQTPNTSFGTAANPFGVVRLLAAGLNINANSATTDYQLMLGAVCNFSGGTGTPVQCVNTIYPAPWINGQTYQINQVSYNNPSTSLTTATGGVFTATSAGGVTVVADAALSGLTGSTNGTLVIATLGTNATKNVYTGSNIYFRIGTAQGAAATLDVYIWGVVYP